MSKGIKRRRRSTCLSMVLALFMAAGWGGGSAGCRCDPPSAAEAAGDVLRVGSPMKVLQANPLADYGYSTFAMLFTHDTLVRFDSKMQPCGQLAESWSVSSDGRQWRFKLRTDAHWHDGRPVEPEDVRFTFQYLAAHHGASAWIKELIRKIDVHGLEITFELARPYSRFLINGGFIVRILPRHVWRSISNPYQPGDADVTLGCGPFAFNGLDHRSGRLMFDANGNYYGPSPAVRRVEIFLNRTGDAMTLSLLRGDIDLFYKYASGFQSSHLPRLENDRSLQMQYADAMGIPAAIGFNMAKAPMSDPVFRHAIAASLDYPRLTCSMLGATGKIPGAGFVPPAFSGDQDPSPLIFDPEKSKALLSQCGLEDSDGDGLRNRPGAGNLVLKLLARSDLEGTDALLPILSYNWNQVGIDVDIERVDLSAWIERVQQQRYDLVLFRTTPWGMMMHAGWATGYFDARRSGGGTLANVTDPIFYDLSDGLLQTVEGTKLKSLRRRVRKYYADHLPAIALCWAVNAYPAVGHWQGMAINQIEGGLLNRQTLTRIHPVDIQP